MGGEGSGRKPDVVKMLIDQQGSTPSILMNAPVMDFQLPNYSGIKTGTDEIFGDYLFINKENVKLAKASNLVTSDYIILAQSEVAPGSAVVAAGSASGHRGVFKGVRARGSLSSPTVPLVDDDAFTLLSALYDGTDTEASAGIFFKVDGTVSDNVAPQRISFVTSETTASARTEKMTIKADGKVGIGTTAPVETLSIGTVPSGNQLNISGSTGGITLSGSLQLGTGNFATSSQAGVTAAALIIPNNSHIYMLNNSGFFRTMMTSSEGGDIDIGQTSTAIVTSVNLKAGNGGYISMVPGGGEAMRITTAGNVGIGTTSPRGKLDVSGGDTYLGNASGHDVFINANGAIGDTNYIQFAGSRTYTGYNGVNGTMEVGCIGGKPIDFIPNAIRSFRMAVSGSFELAEHATNKLPSNNLSGSIFISGGALWYKGFSGTYTRLALS